MKLSLIGRLKLRKTEANEKDIRVSFTSLGTERRTII